jgi:hypothetical protein
MERKYQPTEKQLVKWKALKPAEMPTDEEFKVQWKRQHGGKLTGWGMAKRDWVIQHSDDHLTCTVEYNIGLWQGRVDAAAGLPQAETPNYHTSPYEYGYYRGYTSFGSFWNGYDRNAKVDFETKYIK